MEEIGVTNVADPLGGSWFVEALTDDIEREAEEIFARIKEMSPDGSMTAGILRGIEDGWFMAEIADAAFEYQQKLEKGEKKIVGVNTLTDTVSGELKILRVGHEVEVEQCRVLAERKAHRDEDRVRRTLSALVDAASGTGNLIEPMLEAARAEATMGEICHVLREQWGEYREPARF
jgi:methylmalonyl-CoA mutase N-terminal domain/subunit